MKNLTELSNEISDLVNHLPKPALNWTGSLYCEETTRVKSAFFEVFLGAEYFSFIYGNIPEKALESEMLWIEVKRKVADSLLSANQKLVSKNLVETSIDEALDTLDWRRKYEPKYSDPIRQCLLNAL